MRELRIYWQKLLGRTVRQLVDCRIRWVKNCLIRLFLLIYKPAMEEAEEPNPSGYTSFNDFFSRRLKTSARPIAAAPWVAPADGTLLSHGEITKGRVKVKGQSYQVAELLAMDDAVVRQLAFATVFYLSPRDYHRVHSPCSAMLTRTSFIPGSLFPVNERATRRVASLYARNQRLVFHCDTNQGAMVLVMVAALFVSSIMTSWGLCYKADDHSKEARNHKRRLAKGDEMGYFLMGSSIVLLTERDSQRVLLARVGEKVKMGQPLFSS